MSTGHVLILGGTDAGKSTAAKKLSANFLRHRVNVLVLDPHGTKWPGVPDEYQFRDPYKFLAVAKRSQRCALFVDEAGECIGRGRQARDMQWLTTGARKWGHKTHVMAQEAQMILPVIRKQCSVGLIFRQSEGNARLLVDDFADERLMGITTLGQFEFLHVTRFGDCRRMKFPK